VSLGIVGVLDILSQFTVVLRPHLFAVALLRSAAATSHGLGIYDSQPNRIPAVKHEVFDDLEPIDVAPSLACVYLGVTIVALVFVGCVIRRVVCRSQLNGTHGEYTGLDDVVIDSFLRPPAMSRCHTYDVTSERLWYLQLMDTYLHMMRESEYVYTYEYFGCSVDIVFDVVCRQLDISGRSHDHRPYWNVSGADVQDVLRCASRHLNWQHHQQIVRFPVASEVFRFLCHHETTHGWIVIDGHFIGGAYLCAPRHSQIASSHGEITEGDDLHTFSSDPRPQILCVKVDIWIVFGSVGEIYSKSQRCDAHQSCSVGYPTIASIDELESDSIVSVVVRGLWSFGYVLTCGLVQYAVSLIGYSPAVTSDIQILVAAPLCEELLARHWPVDVKQCKKTLMWCEIVSQLIFGLAAGHLRFGVIYTYLLHSYTAECPATEAVVVHTLYNLCSLVAQSITPATIVHAISNSRGAEANNLRVQASRSRRASNYGGRNSGSARNTTYRPRTPFSTSSSRSDSSQSNGGRESPQSIRSAGSPDGPDLAGVDHPSDQPIQGIGQPSQTQYTEPPVDPAAFPDASVPDTDLDEMRLYQTSYTWWSLLSGEVKWLSPFDATHLVLRRCGFCAYRIVPVNPEHFMTLFRRCASLAVSQTTIRSIRYIASQEGMDLKYLPRLVLQALMIQTVEDGLCGADNTTVPLGDLNALAPASHTREFSGFSMSGILSHLSMSIMGFSEGSISALELPLKLGYSMYRSLIELISSSQQLTVQYLVQQSATLALSLGGLTTISVLLFIVFSMIKWVLRTCINVSLKYLEVVTLGSGVKGFVRQSISTFKVLVMSGPN